MDDTQIKICDHIMNELWEVEDNAVNLEDPEVIAAAKTAVRNLENLLETLEGNHDSLNLSKTWRYLGDAYFSQSGKKNEDALKRGREAYLKAESLLTETGDTQEMAKLQFNLANTTRLIDGGRNRSLLEEARSRYHKARELFKLVMPGIVPQVEDSIESLEIVIRGLGYLESAEEGFEETKDLQARLQAAGDDPQKVLQVQKEYDALQKKVLGPDEQLQKFRTFFESAAPLLNPKDRSREDKLSCIRSKLDELEGQLQDQESPEQPSENALFDMVFGAIGKAGQKGEVDSERETTLRRVLEEFQRIYNRPDGTPEQMALKSREMRELIQRYKNIFLNPQIGNKKDS
jgi:hypothetical protein